MNTRMSLRTRLLIAGIAAVAAIVVTAAVGLFGMMRSNEGLEASITATSAVLHQKQADMMHDALRADVLFSLVTGPYGSPEDQETIRVDLADHVASFDKSIGTLRGLDLPPDLRKAVEDVLPALEAYITSAKEITESGLKDTVAGRERFPEFMKAFSDLEERLEVLGENIERFGNSAGNNALTTNGQLIVTLLVVSVFATILLIAVNWITAGQISRPILGMVSAMQRLAGGDRAIEVPGLGRGDEVGRMAEAVQVFKDNALEADRLTSAQSHDQKMREERTRQLETLCRDFDRQVTQRLQAVIAAVGEMEGTAQSMSRVAENTAAEANQVSHTSEAASGSVNAVAAATEELAASIAEIGQQMSRSREIAGQAANQAVATNAQIKQLAEAAQKIGAVVQLITDIASQTNLLALNATIEAARAGEAGKGFAVVASEVKNLATQTGKATDEISQQINGIQSETGQAVKAIENIAGTIDEINQITSGVAAAVEEQSAATKEIARSVEQAASGNQDMSTRIATVTNAANETGVAAGQLLGSSSSLAKEAQDLRQEIERFLSTIRAI
ncbi:methyl-accepting chemotaxis protein [Dongia sp.]|uniref:methyl-accepting chemotaxis protein n=1 Tax=Dongia sp. TaxID=1977262 RepID=UPI0035B333EC